ncbi:MAG: bacterioferritin [Armatimonadia bacterium]|nr:bacterioferritin [Armatimonadia bacterium]
MSRHEKSIEMLNEALRRELHASFQYMYFHFHADDQGYDPLSQLFRSVAIQEMVHAERLAERILYLKGEVTMELSQENEYVNSPAEMLEFSKKLEDDAVVMYNKFAKQCGEIADSATKRLFEDLIDEEEGHYDQFDLQGEHLEKYGEQFLALQGIERSKSMGGGGQTGPGV